MMMQEFKNVTILLPVMDETFSLSETVETILNTCNHNDLAEIIILVCERTTLDAKNVAEALVEKYSPEVHIYLHNQKLPFVGGAIREGFDLAIGSHVVLMSSDLETDPNLISVFIKYSKENPDYIITASRWKKGGGFKDYNRIKLICNYVFEHLIGWLFASKLSDLTYAFRIFPANLVKQIEWEELKHPFFLETALKPLRLGVKFKEIPARWVARSEGKSQNTFLANFKYFKTAWHIRFLTKNKILKSNASF